MPAPSSPYSRRAFLQSSAFTLGGLHAGSILAQDGKPKPPSFNNYHDATLVDGEPPAIAEGSFTVVALPDSQKYAKANPEGFLAQTSWIAKHKELRNISCVLHLGDITDNNIPPQWELAKKAMNQLDGVVPYFMALGNHDYGANGMCTDRTTLYNEYFPKSTFDKLDTFGGVYDKEPGNMENSYHRFSAGGREFLVLCLEFGPRRDVVRWANEVVAAHPKHAAILVTHVYMYFDDTRYHWKQHGKKQNWNPHAYKVAAATGDDVMDGEELWKNLVSKHPNFIMTLNGHVLEDGLGRLTSSHGASKVHQMLFNCQMRPNGGDSWLRLLEFRKDGSCDVWDYAPQLNKHNTAAENRFRLEWA